MRQTAATPATPTREATTNYNFSSVTTPNSNLYGGSASNVSVHVDSTTCSSSMQADLTYTASGAGCLLEDQPRQYRHGPAHQPDPGLGGFQRCHLLRLLPRRLCGWQLRGQLVHHRRQPARPVRSRLSAGLTYEWQVRANDGVGGTTYANSGVTWTFTTTATPLNQFTYLPLIVRPVTPRQPSASPALPTAPRASRRRPPWIGRMPPAPPAMSTAMTRRSTATAPAAGPPPGRPARSRPRPWPTAPPMNGRYAPAIRAASTDADAGTEWSFTTCRAGAWTTVTTENFEGSFPKWLEPYIHLVMVEYQESELPTIPGSNTVG